MKRSELRTLIKEEARLILREISGTSEIEQLYQILGYESFEEMLDDNPSLVKAIVDWANSVPDYKSELARNGFMQARYLR